MSGYWPWWQGAIALATVTVGYQVVVGRSIGISGAWERVLNWREERAVERANASLDDDEFEAAMAAATAAAFGDPQPPLLARNSPSTVSLDEPAPAQRTPRRAEAPTTPAPVASQALLLVSVLIGAVLAAVSSGRFDIRADMGPAFSDLVGDGPLMWPVLFGGGILVGIGTRMAGGCSSGHGLSGCSRFQPVSLVATAVFFGTGVVVSTLLWKVI